MASEYQQNFYNIPTYLSSLASSCSAKCLSPTSPELSELYNCHSPVKNIAYIELCDPDTAANRHIVDPSVPEAEFVATPVILAVQPYKA